MIKKFGIKTKVREYEKDGEKKSVFMEIGKITQFENGGLGLEWYSQPDTKFYVFEDKPKTENVNKEDSIDISTGEVPDSEIPFQSMHTYNLKLTGKLNIPEELPIGKDFHVALIGSITSITKKNNEDSSFTFDHKFEPFTLEILRENGTTMKVDKTKLSQKLRSRAFIHITIS